MLDFKWRHFDKTMILMSVRWYVAYPLSYRQIEEMMQERCVLVDHSTINRWVVKYAPELETQFRKNHKRPTGSSWRMDETYIKIKGVWHYLYRAVDKTGNTIDFLLCKRRDKQAATRFFKKSISSSILPEKITVDKSGANKAALDTINSDLKNSTTDTSTAPQILIRQVKYLNNIVEQDHRFIKKIVKPKLWFKEFHSAKATLAGIELHHMLKKGQHINDKNRTVFEQFYALAG